MSAPLSTAGKVALVGAAAALAGSFLPWVSVITVFGTIEVSGFDGGDGKLTAAAAIGAMLFGYFGLSKRNGVAGIGVASAIIGLAISMYDWKNASEVVGEDSEFARASIGYGLYLCVAGFTVCAVALISAMRGTSISAPPAGPTVHPNSGSHAT